MTLKRRDGRKETKKRLVKLPKVDFLLPLADGESFGAYDVVQFNGHKMIIKKGIISRVPLPVAELLAEHYRMKMPKNKCHPDPAKRVAYYDDDCGFIWMVLGILAIMLLAMYGFIELILGMYCRAYGLVL